MNKKNNKCFQYTVTFALNNEEIKKDLRRITKIKSFIDKYNCERINFSAEKDDRRKFEKNNITIALNVLHAKKEEIYVWLMFLKHHANREKQTILLIISNGEKWHYLAVKMLSALLRGITSKHYGYFYCLNCVHSFRTKKNKLESHRRVFEDFLQVIVSFKDTKILEFNQYQKSDKAPSIIYADLERLIEKIDVCKNNP